MRNGEGYAEDGGKAGDAQKCCCLLYTSLLGGRASVREPPSRLKARSHDRLPVLASVAHSDLPVLDAPPSWQALQWLACAKATAKVCREMR